MTSSRKLIMFVVGARPNFIKMAPLVHEIQKRREIKDEFLFDYFLVHTGQHYDNEMSNLFFKHLQIPEPNINLGVGSGSHASQTASILTRFEKVLIEVKPDIVVTFGDVNSTLASSLAVSKIDFGVHNDSYIRPLLVHAEAGLRSYDRDMPEEINRIVADHLSNFLLTTTRDAGTNLKKEGISPDKIHFVGNLMIDSLQRFIAEMQNNIDLLPDLEPERFAVVTIHRPENTDRPEKLKEILKALIELSHEYPVIFPVHPRTMPKINDLSYQKEFQPDQLILCKPMGYPDFLYHVAHAGVVITDSGGIQEETTILNVPCITVRKNTERPITVEVGTNIITSANSGEIYHHSVSALRRDWKKGTMPELWDGKTSERVIDLLVWMLGDGN